MAENTVAELKAQFIRMQKVINDTHEMLKNMEGGTEIVAICPEYCAPVKVINPPRTYEDCAIKMHRLEGAITVTNTEETIRQLNRWAEKMIEVLDHADPGLPLP